MPELEISCVIKNHLGEITHLGIDNKKIFSVMQVILSILDGRYSYYTYQYGYKVQVYAVQDPSTRKWFLTLEPDNPHEHQLNFLTACSQ